VRDDLHAPGRKRLVRRGRVDVYWVADVKAVRAGYTPKTVALGDDPGDVRATPEIAAFCRRLWAEMKAFLAGQTRPGVRATVGTIAWLADVYQSEPDSPYQHLRPSSRPGYDKALAIVRETVGARRIDTVTSSDVRRWFKGWGRAGDGGELANPRRAYSCVQLLRIIVKFGKGQRLAGCRDLSEILSDSEFPAPRGRRVAMTAEQAHAIIANARERGSAGLARAVALQFGCALRQKDVIGEWVSGQWTSGLLWGEHIRPDWTLAKPTSKTNFRETAEFDLKLIPLALVELQAVAPTSRIGPVILDERSGKPYRQREFARRFREVARAAGVPDEVWSMDARAGAVTDARRAGATRADAMDLATHTQEATNRRYDRDRIAATNRVSVLRFGKEGSGNKGE
jgi:hypothetical protein